MNHTQEDRTLALAGIYQAVKLVQEIARKGSISDAHISSLLETLFRFDVNTAADVYGDTSTVKKGLQMLADQLSGKSSATDMEITRYAIQLLNLEKALKKSPTIMQELSEKLEKTQAKMDYFDPNHENIIASLADIYQENISPLGTKLMIKGETNFLTQASNANKIRALLLAGIRSAVLWRQCGGSRWQLLFSRKDYLKSATKLLNQI